MQVYSVLEEELADSTLKQVSQAQGPVYLLVAELVCLPEVEVQERRGEG
jgi:hypothetical protein